MLKLAGYALYPNGRGVIQEVPSCVDCAKKLGSAWRPALFEDVECACGAQLTGFPDGGTKK